MCLSDAAEFPAQRKQQQSFKHNLTAKHIYGLLRKALVLSYITLGRHHWLKAKPEDETRHLLTSNHLFSSGLSSSSQQVVVITSRYEDMSLLGLLRAILTNPTKVQKQSNTHSHCMTVSSCSSRSHNRILIFTSI